MRTPLFYHQKPTFGLDIGRSTIKVVQLKQHEQAIQVVGYGYTKFDKSAVTNGIISNPAMLAKVVQPVLQQIGIGKLTTNRIAASVPLGHTYTRIMRVPKMSNKDLAQAVQLEAEQYIPVPLKELYAEHQILKVPGGEKTDQLQILIVAVPKTIIDSLVQFFEGLKLEVSAIEPNMFSNLRAIELTVPSAEPQIVIDFGAHSSDLAIYHNKTVLLTSALAKGGEHITQIIASTLKLTPDRASQLKARYGIGKSRWQAKLAAALEPILSDFANEVQKMMRYYHEHSTEQSPPIKRILLVGGGANMPGVGDFLTHLTGVEAQVCNPWEKLQVKPLQPPPMAETTIYATAIGLALKDIYHD
jgi:type IV pilus assembly protein PilM